MKPLTLAAITLFGGALVAAAAYQLGVHRSMGQVNAAAPPAVLTIARPDSASERRVLYWHDPMVPGRRFDKPGKSPFMDMQLVPVYADESSAAGISVNPALAQSLGIRTALVRKAEMASSIEAVGTVTQNERATQVVQSRVTGFVEKLYVRAVLDPVRKDQALATLFAPEWAAALEEYLGIRQAQAGAALIDAARSRLRLLSIPDDVVTRSEQTGTAQTRFTLTAPTAGVVTELGIRDGAMVSPGMTLFRIVDLSSVWVMAEVPASLAPQVRIGSAAQVHVDGIGKSFGGRLSAILPDVDLATRTLKARVELRNPRLVLKPGMFVRVTFRQSSAEPALLIPQEAVIATGKRNVVIVVGEGDKYSPVEVQLGRESGGEVEVRSGLTEGQRVLSSGQFLLDSEASLKSGFARMAPVGPDNASARHSGTGRIAAIGADELTISHGPIASLKWGAMTMPFKNPRAGLPKDLKAGEPIQFDFVQQGDDYVLQSITPLASGTRP